MAEADIRVDNYKCTVSLCKRLTRVLFLFRCLIDNCTFSSTTFKDVLTHLGDHPQAKWGGFCYACDSRIRNEEVDVLDEVDHFSEEHYDWRKYQLSLKDHKIIPTSQDVSITVSKRRRSQQTNPPLSTQTEITLNAAVESPEVDSLTREIAVPCDEKHSSEDHPALTIDHNNDSTLYDNYSMNLEPLNDEPDESGFIGGDQSNNESLSVQQTQPETITVVDSDEEDEPAKKKPRTIAEFTITTGKPDKTNHRCIHYKCWYCEQSADRLRKIYDHWNEGKEDHKGFPFLFTVEKVSKCFYCRTCTTYKDLKNHISDKHKGFTITTGKPDKTNHRFIHYKCWYCGLSADSPRKIYDHWNEGKEDHKEFPFLFTVEKVFKCFYCRTCTTYKDLKNHISDKHKGCTFAMVDNWISKRCGLGCGMVEKQMDDHFKENHKDQKNETEIKISEDLNNETLSDIIKRIENEIPEKKIIDPNVPIKFRCHVVGCSLTTNNEYEIFEHMRKHFIFFKCEYEECDKQFDNEGLLKTHMKCMEHSHSGNPDYKAYPNIDAEEYRNEYELMQIIFPCGLLLTKRDCEKTKYGRTDDIINTVRRIDQKDLEVRQQEQEELKIKSVDLEATQQEKHQKKSVSKASTKSKMSAKKLKR